MKMPDRMNGAWFVFFLGLSIPVLLIPRTAYAAATCDAITGKLPGSNPGNLTLNSPIIDQSGLPLGDALKPLGFIAKLKQLSQLSGWCGFKARDINIRFWVRGTDHQLYNLRSVFDQAETVQTVLQAVPSPTVTAASPLPADPWTSVFQPEYANLQGGKPPCSAPMTSCGNFQDALTKAAASGTSDLPTVLPTFQFVTYKNFFGKVQTQPFFGAAFEPGPTPAPAAQKFSYANRLTVYIGGNAYTAVDLDQDIDLNPTDKYLYQISAKVGPDVPGFSGFQLYQSQYASKTLAFSQSNSQGKDFTFCPSASVPLYGATGISLTATLSCKGSATIGYDVNVTPGVGYARIDPAFDVRLSGALIFNATVAVGTAEADLTLASFSGGGGILYGVFSDPSNGGAKFFAERQFEYFDATAVSVDIVLSVKFVWGTSLPPKKIHLYTLAESHQPPIGDWYVTKLAQ